jgi:hypothetical protein
MPLKFSTLFQSHLQVSILSEDDFEIKSKIYSIKLRLVFESDIPLKQPYRHY